MKLVKQENAANGIPACLAMVLEFKYEKDLEPTLRYGIRERFTQWTEIFSVLNKFKRKYEFEDVVMNNTSWGFEPPVIPTSREVACRLNGQQKGCAIVATSEGNDVRFVVCHRGEVYDPAEKHVGAAASLTPCMVWFLEEAP
jgi:hypothetical protein